VGLLVYLFVYKRVSTLLGKWVKSFVVLYTSILVGLTVCSFVYK
jgi:hypothetical protein